MITKVYECATCEELPIRTGSGIGTDQPVTQTLGTNADGCVTNTFVCTGPADTETVIFWYDADGNDAGVTQGIGSAMSTLTCNEDGEWVMDGFTMSVSSAECVAAVA